MKKAKHKLNKEQMAAVGDIDHNLCVVAGAGCGKTAVLVERYIHALATDRDLKVGNLAAITFTENAASQMRDRIRRECVERMEGADVMARERWLRRKRDLDAAAVSTIHGFCASILRRWPTEAGVDPMFGILDDAAGALMLADSVSGAIKDLIDADDGELLLMLRHHSLFAVRQMVSALVGQRERLTAVVEPALARPDEEIIRDIREEILRAKRAAVAALLGDPECRTSGGILRKCRGREGDKLEDRRRDMLDILSRLQSDTPRQVDESLAALFALDRRKVGAAKNWPSADAIDEVREAIAAIVDLREKHLGDVKDLDVTDLEGQHLRLVRALAAVARKAVQAYQRAKADAGMLDYEDLEILTRDLLRKDETVRRALAAGYHQVLVDELQDTNSLQLEIVRLLTEGDRRAARPGAFFAVGDPKQSIYRFRGAEVEVFDETLRRLGPRGRVDLLESFRLNDASAAFVNEVFPELLVDIYTPIESARGRSALNPHSVEILLAEAGESSNAEERRDAEARLIAQRIEEIVGKLRVTDHRSGEVRPARYGDIAMLFRAATSLHLYEHALKDRGIPYHVVGGFGFYRQQEIRDVVSYLRVLENPSDDLHLAGLLRSPFFAVSDEGLYHLRLSGGTLWSAVRSAETEGAFCDADRVALVRARGEIEQLLHLKDRLPLAELLDRLVFESGYALSVAGQFAGERRFANLRQMIELARQFDRTAPLTMADFIRYLDDFVKSELRREQAPIEPAEGDVVQVMTIHKAKGLEFPIVIVPDIGAKTRGKQAKSVYIHPLTGLALKVRDEEEGEKRKKARPAAYLLAKRADDEAERREHVRTFYVAATRAREYLVLSANTKVEDTSWLAELKRVLSLETKRGETEIPYGKGGKHKLRLFVERPGPPAHKAPKRVGPRDVFCDGRLVREAVERMGQGNPPRGFAELIDRIKPPPAARPSAAAGFISATALADFEKCPMLYRLRYELGLSDAVAASSAGVMTAAEEGLVFHQVFDKSVLEPDADVGRIAARAIRASGVRLSDNKRTEFIALAEDRVRAFWNSDLGSRARRAASRDTEAPFLLKIGGAAISGVIDLVLYGEDGEAEIVDYKSNRVAAEEAKKRAGAYEIQLGVYALAMSRHLGRPPRTSVYFIRPALAVEIATDEAALGKIEKRTGELTRGIVLGERRRNLSLCATCALQSVCSAMGVS